MVVAGAEAVAEAAESVLAETAVTVAAAVVAVAAAAAVQFRLGDASGTKRPKEQRPGLGQLGQSCVVDLIPLFITYQRLFLVVT